MTKTIRKDGYVSVYENGKQYLEHRKLAEMFIPNPDNKPCINHKDGNRSNNSLDNLEWVTYSENHIHAHRILKRKVSGRAEKLKNGEIKGEKCWNAKLNKNKVEEIRNSNLSAIELSKLYNVSKCLIYAVKSNKRWN